MNHAQVAELVDAHVSGACAARRAGSSPVLGTLFFYKFILTMCRRGGGIGRRATLRGECQLRRGSSSLLLFTLAGGNSSVGRAQPCQGWGRGFESRSPLIIFFCLFS